MNFTVSETYILHIITYGIGYYNANFSFFSKIYRKGRVVSNNSVYKKGDNSHILDFDISDNRLSCFDNISLEEVLEGGLVTFVYYGQQKISQHNTRIINAEYSTKQSISHKNDIKLDIGINFANRQQLATRYPYYRQQNLVTKKIYTLLHHTTNLQGTKKLTASLMVSMQKGYGCPYTDGQIAPWVATIGKQHTTNARIRIYV